MREINFEGLGVYLNINNVMLDFGGLKIYWYAFFIVISIALALVLCKEDDGKYGIKFDNILELALFMLPISIICARLYFIVFKLDYYIQNPSQIINIQNGGLAIYGGIIGAVLTIIIYCKIKKINFIDMMDYIVPYLALGQAIGRWGNFFNGEAHGIETSSILRMGIVENGKYIQVHPTFLYESICTISIFLLLYIFRNKRKYSGQFICIYFIIYGIARALIEGLRTDSLMLGNIRISQILSILLAITFGIIMIIKRRKYENKTLDNNNSINNIRSDNKNIVNK